MSTGLLKSGFSQTVGKECLVSLDPDFPDDPDEVFYFVPAEKQLTASTGIAETATVEGRTKMDAEMAEALLGRGGALSKDACIRIPGMQNRDAEMAFLQMYEKDIGNLPALPEEVLPLPEDDDPLPEKPMTGIEKARVLLPKILSEGQLAGGFVVSLQAHDMSDRMISQMKEHQQFMNSAYKLLQSKVKSNDESGYDTFTKLVEKKMATNVNSIM
jgi:hypothetical protein